LALGTGVQTSWKRGRCKPSEWSLESKLKLKRIKFASENCVWTGVLECTYLILLKYRCAFWPVIM
jgi:hypothetical protein